MVQVMKIAGVVLLLAASAAFASTVDIAYYDDTQCSDENGSTSTFTSSQCVTDSAGNNVTFHCTNSRSFHIYFWDEAGCTGPADQSSLFPCDAWTPHGEQSNECLSSSIKFYANCSNPFHHSSCAVTRVQLGQCTQLAGIDGLWAKFNRFHSPKLLVQRYSYSDGSCVDQDDVDTVFNGGCFQDESSVGSQTWTCNTTDNTRPSVRSVRRT